MVIAYNYIVFDNGLDKVALNTFNLSDIYKFYNTNNIEDILNMYYQRYTLTIKPCDMSDMQ